MVLLLLTEDAKLEVSYRGFQMTAVVVLVIASSAPAIFAQPHARPGTRRCQ